MSNQKSFTAKFNFPAPLVEKKDIDDILDLSRQCNYYFIDWLEYFFDINRCCFSKELLERFCKINNVENFMTVVPIGTKKLDKIESSIKNSCRCFSLGLFESSIALTGVSAEILTIMIWEMNRELKGVSISKKEEEKIFGAKFDDKKIDQYRKIQILRGAGILSKQQSQKLHFIREMRNKVVHYQEEYSIADMEKDAMQCYYNAINLFKEVTEIQINSGKITYINPYFTS